MEPFDLERALAGDPVVTRDGREVTQIHVFDTPEKYKVYGVVRDKYITCWDINGNYTHGLEESNHDLLMKPKVIEGWFNVHVNNNGIVVIGISYPSEEVAKANIVEISTYIKTIKITNEMK